MDKLPNDIIMRIIREADGGRNTHKMKITESLVRLVDAKKSADEYIHRHIEDEEYDWEDNYDEWNYAFWESL
tara:strand:- start:291 stop:506 length:216 start_codon:yes stop_codon:yes gene_type:complete